MPNNSNRLNFSIPAWIRFLVSAFLIVLLFFIVRGDSEEIIEQLSRANLPIYILSLLLLIIGVVVMSVRLKVILKVQNSLLGFKKVVLLSFIGQFFNIFLPTSVGGDIVKGFYLSQNSRKKVETYTAVFIDRVIGAVSFVFIAAILLLFKGGSIENKSVHYAVYILFAVVAALGLLVSRRELLSKIFNLTWLNKILVFLRIDNIIKKIYNAVDGYKNHKNILLLAFAISITAQLFVVLCLYFLARSVGAYVRLAELLLVVPVMATISMLPISLGGLGLREGALIGLLGPSMGYASATALAVLFLSVFLISCCIGGLIYALRGWLL